MIKKHFFSCTPVLYQQQSETKVIALIDGRLVELVKVPNRIRLSWRTGRASVFLIYEGANYSGSWGQKIVLEIEARGRGSARL